MNDILRMAPFRIDFVRGVERSRMTVGYWMSEYPVQRVVVTRPEQESWHHPRLPWASVVLQ